MIDSSSKYLSRPTNCSVFPIQCVISSTIYDGGFKIYDYDGNIITGSIQIRYGFYLRFLLKVEEGKIKN